MIIDGSNLVLGRLAAYAAKKALEGETITILNCENVVITGDKVFTKNKFKEMLDKGHPYHGPFFSRMPDRYVKRVIRGMLPYKKPKGVSAMKRLRIFIGFPAKAEGKHIMVLENASKEVKAKYITIGGLAKSFGWKE